MPELLQLRPALRAATPFPLDAEMIEECLDDKRDRFDALFRRARDVGLLGLPRSERSGHLWRVVGEVAESVAELTLTDLGYSVVWHISDPGVHGSISCSCRQTRACSRSRSRAPCVLERSRG